MQWNSDYENSLKNAVALSYQAKHEEASEKYRLILDSMRRNKCSDTVIAAKTIYELARSTMFLGRNEEAVALAQSALELATKLQGEESFLVAEICSLLGAIQIRQPDWAAAAITLERGLWAGRKAGAKADHNRGEKMNFEVEQQDQVRLLSSVFRKLGDPKNAQRVLDEMPKPEPKPPEPR